MYSFPDLELVYCSMSGSNCCFLTCIYISQEAGQVVWYSHLFKNFPQFVVIHTSKAIHPERGSRDWGQRAWVQLVLPLIFCFPPKPEGTPRCGKHCPSGLQYAFHSHSLGSAFLCVGHVAIAESIQLSWQSFYTHWTQAVTEDETGISISPPSRAEMCLSAFPATDRCPRQAGNLMPHASPRALWISLLIFWAFFFLPGWSIVLFVWNSVQESYINTIYLQPTFYFIQSEHAFVDSCGSVHSFNLVYMNRIKSKKNWHGLLDTKGYYSQAWEAVVWR